MSPRFLPMRAVLVAGAAAALGSGAGQLIDFRPADRASGQGAVSACPHSGIRSARSARPRALSRPAVDWAAVCLTEHAAACLTGLRAHSRPPAQARQSAPRRAPARAGLFWAVRDQRPTCSERAPASADAFLSHQPDDFGTDFCCVQFRLAVGKPHDDFCGLLSIGVGPQIKIGNDLVESLKESAIAFGSKVRLSSSMRFSGKARASTSWKGLQRRKCTPPGLGCKRNALTSNKEMATIPPGAKGPRLLQFNAAPKDRRFQTQTRYLLRGVRVYVHSRGCWGTF